MKRLFSPILLLAIATNMMAQTTKSYRFDINGNDQNVTVTDLVHLINGVKDDNARTTKCDVNRDNSYNLEDVNMMANFLKNECAMGGYTYVDLGLPSGTLWAAVNVGAKNPEDFGDYYAWGDDTEKTSYTWSTYSLCDGSSNKITEYNNSLDYGKVDNKTELETDEDIARCEWSSLWLMPTNTEIAELRNSSYCTWATETLNNVKGYRVTSKTNGNSIFLPFAGYKSGSTLAQAGSTGYYWSSTLNETTPTTAYCMVIDNSNFTHCNIRSWGRSVRPVIR